jgi:hypothetical protein
VSTTDIPAAARDLHAEAERRLGRRLTAGERVIDLAGLDRDLEGGKAELHRAIEREKARAARALARDRPRHLQRLAVTAEMVRALRRLYAAGLRTARAEVARLGVEPAAPPLKLARSGEDEPLPDELADLEGALRAHLAAVTGRLEVAAVEEPAALLGPAAASALERALIRRVPGGLDAASRLVSPAFLHGLAAGYAPVLDVMGGWTYSAIGDAATCGVCAYWDGKRFDTWSAIEAVLPGGGPNPSCYGGSRCRCRPVAEPPLAPAA